MTHGLSMFSWPPLRSPHLKPLELPARNLKTFGEVATLTARQPRGRTTVKEPVAEKPHSPTNRGGNKDTEINPTQLDVSQEVSSSPPENAAADTKDPPQDPTQAVAQGWSQKDQGGEEDCGFRALADAIHWHKHRGKIDLGQEGARKQGAWIRTQALNHIRKHRARYEATLIADHDSQFKSFDVWTDSMSKANSWINGVMLQAISEKTGHPIVVFKENQFSWERFCFASRFSRGIACAATNCEPLVIILKKKHYSSLRNPIDVTCPKSWLQETAQVSGKIFVGAGKRPKSDATPSVKSFRPSTATNCDLVPVIARSVKSTNTPSIHTEASEATPSVHTLRKMASVAGHRSYKKQVSSGVTPSVHTLNLSAAYVGSCSTKASRPDFDPSDKKVDTDTSDPLVWTCRLCPGHTKFTAKSRPQLQWTRANHLKKRHPNRTEKMSDPLRKLTPAVIATDCLTYQGTNGKKVSKLTFKRNT